MMHPWQPIETAPKDGTRILACVGPPVTIPPPDYEWAYAPTTVSWRTYHPNATGKACWRDSSGVKTDRIRWWMPLPEPPSPEPTCGTCVKRAQDSVCGEIAMSTYGHPRQDADKACPYHKP